MTARVNSFPGNCPICKVRVEGQQGVVWKDEKAGKWVTFCAKDVPDDIADSIRPGYSGHRYNRATKTVVPRTAIPTTPGITTPLGRSMTQAQQQVMVGRPAPVLVTPAAPTIVVFYGPIKSSADHDEHYIYPGSVEVIHDITDDIKSATHVVHVSPEQKKNWTPPTGDYFVVGPKYTSAEYDEAREALADWLEQRGITR